MMPGRYAKNESSEGFLGSIDMFAYRMPVAPEPGIEGEGVADAAESQADDEAEGKTITGLVSTNR